MRFDIDPIFNQESNDGKKTFVFILFTIFAPEEESIFTVAVEWIDIGSVLDKETIIMSIKLSLIFLLSAKRNNNLKKNRF